MASTVSIPEQSTRQLVVFRLAARVFGIELGAVREILPSRRATRLPGASASVLGLINVRGTIVTVLDLGERLIGKAADALGSVILVDHGSKAVGLAVDEVLDVQNLDNDAMAPGAADAVPGGAVRALGRHEGHTVVLLDPHDIISHLLA